jgi:hypothetical protein
VKFFVLDERHIWHQPAITAAKNHGHSGKRILKGEEVDSEGLGFIRPHADPAALKRNQRDYDLMAARLKMFQDETQVRCYEDKSQQFARWGQWMPDTWRFTDIASAVAFLQIAPYPLVSKADVGASSVNVRILGNEVVALQHVRQVFNEGVSVHHCGGRARSLQKDYVLLQRFVPHTVTWRVNAVGNARAVFMRYCYKDKPVAETGNVEPAMEMTPQIESLLEYSNRFFAEAGTKWCAIDVLFDNGEWKLLESSLAFPWPSPGKCNDAPIFGTKRRWIGLFEALFDEYETGAWQNTGP